MKTKISQLYPKQKKKKDGKRKTKNRKVWTEKRGERKKERGVHGAEKALILETRWMGCYQRVGVPSE